VRLFDEGQGVDAVQRLFFERHGRDLLCKLPISFTQAALGATVEVPTLSGKAEVKIPPGVRDGSRVRIAGKGGPGYSGGSAGDLYLLTSVKPNKRFQRTGDDLTTEVDVPLTDAVLGSEIHVPTIAGKKLALKIPPETQNGKVFRLAGQGMPKLGDKTRGDLLVKVKVVLPTKLSKREKELFEELKSLHS